MTLAHKQLHEALFEAHAYLVGERLELRGMDPRVATHPLVVALGEGWAALFRYGAIVFFSVPEAARTAFVEGLSGRTTGAYDKPRHEVVKIRVGPPALETESETGEIVLDDATLERLQVVADILAKSVVLDHYEHEVADVFNAVEPLAVELGGAGVGRQVRDLLSHIGGTLLIQHKMVGRVEVSEKPDLLWERPGLERLYLRLEDEFELSERHTALERKLHLINVTATTALEIVRDRRTHRVEWYIVLLIVVEIVLTLYEMFFRP